MDRYDIEGARLALTVSIPTKGRAKAVRDISLPSLLRQDIKNFEVVVWDASDDRETEEVCEEMRPKFDQIGVRLRYCRAPRSGLPSQRNDSVKAAEGDIIYFIDDDLEVGVGCLRAIIRAFDSSPWLMGCAPPLYNVVPGTHGTDKNLQFKLFRKIKDLGFRIFWGTRPLMPVVRPSTLPARPLIESQGPAEILWGGNMAYRREVFEELQLDERLQRFGGYAFCEDIDFSHRVFLHFKRPLMIIDSPAVFHLPDKSSRYEDPSARVAMYLFNTWLIRENFKRYADYPIVPFIWAMRIGGMLSTYAATARCGLSDLYRGWKRYRQERRRVLEADSQ